MVIEKPLITFAVIAYKSENYIREAVEGAFSQTYKPLQIVLSDDASPDATFQIMEGMAKTYNGPHSILLNCNDHNLGIGAHINRIMELADGELVVVAAGDDVSLPIRTQRIFEAYSEAKGQAFSLFSDLVEIDSEGNRLRQVSTKPEQDSTNLNKWAKLIFPGVVGATHAWHRKTFDFFGPMLPSVSFEDRAIPLRSALLGSIKHIEEPLVLYRKHDLNVSQIYHSKAGSISVLKGELAVCQNAVRDIDTYISNYGHHRPELDQLKRYLVRRIRKHQAYLKMYDGTLPEKTQGLMEIVYYRGHPARALSLWWSESRTQLRKAHRNE